MDNIAFTITRLPRIVFGAGKVAEIPTQIATYGKRVLIVTGAQSFRATPHWDALLQGLQQQGITWATCAVHGEPSPYWIDETVQTYRTDNIEVVLGIGGGSALDAAKAIAGLLPSGHSVMNYLEGVGKNLSYQPPAIPFIAVPTTAGTGSEATKNAVLSVQGQNGFKKSFRHEALVAEVAIVDPNLLATCPPALIAADGMDAFTQLLESYVSSQANPMMDALAFSGMQAFVSGFFAVWEGTADEQTIQQGRAQLAYASLLSGITLAQVGLGSVHGLASPLGAFFPCPHGVVCGTLVAEATAINLVALQARTPQHPALAKYAHVGRLLADCDSLSVTEAHQALVDTLRHWTTRLNLPLLRDYGMQLTDIDRIVANARGGSMKTNPILLTDDELREVLKRRL